MLNIHMDSKINRAYKQLGKTFQQNTYLEYFVILFSSIAFRIYAVHFARLENTQNEFLKILHYRTEYLFVACETAAKKI